MTDRKHSAQRNTGRKRPGGTPRARSTGRRSGRSGRKRRAGLWITLTALTLSAVLCGGMAYLYYLYEYDPEGWGELVSMTHYNGIDVSRHNGLINWQRVAADEKVEYVYVKATEGANFRDLLYRRNITRAREEGLPAGSYHYFSMTSTPREQFDNMRRTIRPEEQDLPLMIDVEDLDRHDPAQVRAAVLELARLAEGYYGHKPLIYANIHDYKRFLAPDLDNYPLFLAHYSLVAQCPRSNPYTLWQYSDRGRVNGITGFVDLSRLHKGLQTRDMLLKKR